MSFKRYKNTAPLSYVYSFNQLITVCTQKRCTDDFKSRFLWVSRYHVVASVFFDVWCERLKSTATYTKSVWNDTRIAQSKSNKLKKNRDDIEWDEREMTIDDDVNRYDWWVIIKMVNILQVRLQFVGKSILFLSTTNQPRHAEECRTV